LNAVTEGPDCLFMDDSSSLEESSEEAALLEEVLD
jgi:hypothetical protein